MRPITALHVVLALAAVAVVGTQGVPLLTWTPQLIAPATLPWLCLLLAAAALAEAQRVVGACVPIILAFDRGGFCFEV